MNSIVLCCRMVLNQRDFKPRMPNGSVTISVTTITNEIPLSVTDDWKSPDLVPGMWNMELKADDWMR